jgi:hypothetical protein
MSTETPLLRRISEDEGDRDLFPSEVHRLHEAGQAAAARKALQKHVTSERDAARRDKQMEFAEDPYLWLEPMKGTPGLGTINGIGMRMYGTHKPDGHGHYITVHYFTMVFIPVLPLGAYVVEDAEGGGWFFLAKAPLPLFARVWQMAFAALVVAGIGAAGWGFQQHRTHTDVLAYNGGPVALEIQVGDESVLVGSGQHHELSGVPAGPVVFTASVPGPGGTPVEIDRVETDLAPYGGEDVVYNAGGLGVFATTYVQYGDGEPPEGFLLGAEPVIVVAHDYALREPPSTMSLSSGKKGDSRSVLEPLVDGWTQGQLFDLLVEEHGMPDGVRYARAWLEVDPEQRGLHYSSMMPVGDDDDGPALLALSETMTTLHPESVLAHRYAQTVRVTQGAGRDELAREYGEWAAEDPTNPDRVYLHARMLDGVDPEAADRLLEGNLKGHPDHAWSHRALGHSAMELEEPLRSLGHYDAFAGEDLDRNYELYPMLLMLQRVADGATWSPGVASRLDRAEQLGETGYQVTQRRLVHRAAARAGSLEEIISLYEGEWVAAGGQPMEGLDRAWITAQAGSAGGWHEAVVPALVALQDNPDFVQSIAEFQLLLALSDGGDRAAVSQALTVLTPDLNLGLDLAMVVAAAERAVDPEAAAARVEGLRETAGLDDPSHVLRPELDLTDADAVRGAIFAVDPPQRGAAWAAVAVALDAEGKADHPVARTARAAARTWGYPGLVPYWED